MTEDESKAIEASCRLLEKDKENRLKAFHEEYLSLCERYNCEWMAEVISVPLGNGAYGNAPRLYIYVRDRKK